MNRKASLYHVQFAAESPLRKVIREVAISPRKSLRHLHVVIQAAFGWQACHLYNFSTLDDPSYWIGNPYLTDEPDIINDKDLKIKDLIKAPGDRLRYDYDFGAGWEVAIELVGPFTPTYKKIPQLLLMEGLNIPEDCMPPVYDALYEKTKAAKELREHFWYNGWVKDLPNSVLMTDVHFMMEMSRAQRFENSQERFFKSH